MGTPTESNPVKHGLPRWQRNGSLSALMNEPANFAQPSWLTTYIPDDKQIDQLASIYQQPREQRRTLNREG